MKYQHELVLRFYSDFKFELDAHSMELLEKSIILIMRLANDCTHQDIIVSYRDLNSHTSEKYESAEEELIRLRALEKILIEQGKIK